MVHPHVCGEAGAKWTASVVRTRPSERPPDMAANSLPCTRRGELRECPERFQTRPFFSVGVRARTWSGGIGPSVGPDTNGLPGTC